MQISDVQALLDKIDTEYRAAKSGLSGLSSGSTRHEVIVAHMGRAQEASAELITLIGSDAALPMIREALDKGAS